MSFARRDILSATAVSILQPRFARHAPLSLEHFLAYKRLPDGYAERIIGTLQSITSEAVELVIDRPARLRNPDIIADAIRHGAVSEMWLAGEMDWRDLYLLVPFLEDSDVFLGLESVGGDAKKAILRDLTKAITAMDEQFRATGQKRTGNDFLRKQWLSPASAELTIDRELLEWAELACFRDFGLPPKHAIKDTGMMADLWLARHGGIHAESLMGIDDVLNPVYSFLGPHTLAANRYVLLQIRARIARDFAQFQPDEYRIFVREQDLKSRKPKRALLKGARMALAAFAHVGSQMTPHSSEAAALSSRRRLLRLDSKDAHSPISAALPPPQDISVEYQIVAPISREAPLMPVPR